MIVELFLLTLDSDVPIELPAPALVPDADLPNLADDDNDDDGP